MRAIPTYVINDMSATPGWQHVCYHMYLERLWAIALLLPMVYVTPVGEDTYVIHVLSGRTLGGNTCATTLVLNTRR